MEAVTNSKPFTGKTIVVTRPAHQAGELAAWIRDAGGTPIIFPVIEIVDVADPRPLIDLIARLDEFDLAIFISPNAASKAMPLIASHGTLPASLKIAAIGKGGARELEKFGVRNIIVPPLRFDSEGLLAMPELQNVSGWRVVIFRGDGGRELLGDTLRARGASVDYAACYRREKPIASAQPLLEAWQQNKLSAIAVTSSEGLHNLAAMLGQSGLALLEKTPLFVPHPRIAETARELGLTEVILTPPTDAGLLEGLIAYFNLS